MHINRAIENVVVAVANLVEEGFARFHAAARFRKTRKQVELHRRQHERRRIENSATRVEIDPEGADYNFGGRRGGIGGGGGICGTATQHRTEPGEQFAGRECFRQIIVRTHLETDDAIGFITPRREHQNGDLAARPNSFQDFEPVDAGQHDIEDHCMPVFVRRGCAIDTVETGMHRDHIETERVKIGGDEAAEFAVIIDHEEPCAAGLAFGHHDVVRKSGGGRNCRARQFVNASGLSSSAATDARFGRKRQTHGGVVRRLLCVLPLVIGWHGAAADLTLNFVPRWKQSEMKVPSSVVRNEPGQALRVTRFAALISAVALTHADGSVVQLTGQYGFIDVETGRLAVVLRNLPNGDYAGLDFEFGLEPEINHGDPGRWSAGHPLNPLVNGLHWSWQGGYVFAALEGRWSEPRLPGEERGFSFHLATDELRTAVRFIAAFRVEDDSTIDLALDFSRILSSHRFAPEDGSESTHSATGDHVADRIAAALQRACFWLGAGKGGLADDLETSASAESATDEIVSAVTPFTFTIPAGFPQPSLPSDNALTVDGVALGEVLFFDARLSGNATQSCASCHIPRRGFSDTVALSRGADGEEGVRNAMPLVNLAWSPRYAWDGSQPRIRDQAIAAWTNPIEMHGQPEWIATLLANDEVLVAKFERAFGTREVTAQRVTLALEQYLLTQVAADSKFDRALRGAAELTDQEKRGFELFATEYDPTRGRTGADCFHCHGGSLFTDFAMKNNGLDIVAKDAGRAGVSQKENDAGKFKTPSLRNVALTAPYMHDGRFATLEEVVAHYDHGVKRSASLDPNLAKHPDDGLQLSKDDQLAIVAFLRTLTESCLEPIAIVARVDE